MLISQFNSNMSNWYILCVDINECDDNPCGNNSCTNELGGFSCVCNPGYRGEHCEENIDECLTNICQNNSTCVDGINEYNCLCPPNYKGDFCEILFCESSIKHIYKASVEYFCVVSSKLQALVFFLFIYLIFL